MSSDCRCRISQNNQIFTSDELGICHGSSHCQGSLDCRSQMVSGVCFKGNGQYRGQEETVHDDESKLYCYRSKSPKKCEKNAGSWVDETKYQRWEEHFSVVSFPSINQQPNGADDRGEWRALARWRTPQQPSGQVPMASAPHHGKLSYRRKHSCYPFLDDLFQRVRYRCQTVLVYA